MGAVALVLLAGGLAPAGALAQGGASVPRADGVGAVPASSSVERSARVVLGSPANRLSVRAGRGTGETLTRLRHARTVRVQCRATGRLARGVLGRYRTWMKVRVDGRTGWVPAASVRVSGGSRALARCTGATGSTPNATVVVRSTGLALRSAPRVDADLQRRLARGTRVALACRATGDRANGSTRWAKVVAPRSGWVHASYLRVDGGVALTACEAGDLPPANPVVPTPTTDATPSGAGNNGGSGQCVRTPTVTPTGRFGSAAEFVAAAAPAARRSQRETGVPASVTIAQAILESGFGNSHLGSNNFFGIKATRAGVLWRWGQNAVGCVVRRTAEQTSSGSVYYVDAGFRMYRSMGDSFVDHGSFLRDNARYRPAFAHVGDPKRFATEIWRAGYATDTRYPAKLHDLMDRYGLGEHDAV